jgi:hypothetical protein
MQWSSVADPPRTLCLGTCLQHTSPRALSSGSCYFEMIGNPILRCVEIGEHAALMPIEFAKTSFKEPLASLFLVQLRQPHQDRDQPKV